MTNLGIDITKIIRTYMIGHLTMGRDLASGYLRSLGGLALLRSLGGFALLRSLGGYKTIIIMFFNQSNLKYIFLLHKLAGIQIQ